MKSVQEMIKDHMEVCPDFSPPDPRGTFLALAHAGEAGELANLFKKEWRDGRTAERMQKIIKEMADCRAYMLMLERHMGVDLDAMVEATLIEFEQRPEYQKLLEDRRRRA
jgi:NTP pyrophosphatase (non-canonical NTP hydrolase)